VTAAAPAATTTGLWSPAKDIAHFVTNIHAFSFRNCCLVRLDIKDGRKTEPKGNLRELRRKGNMLSS
jgi:hypothetical protein